MLEIAAQPDLYEIRVKGYLAPRWSELFAGLAMTHTTSGETILSGPIEDQAALHGVLAKVRDLNLTLIAVNRMERECTSTVATPRQTDA
jgi:hypothetical protein